MPDVADRGRRLPAAQPCLSLVSKDCIGEQSNHLLACPARRRCYDFDEYMVRLIQFEMRQRRVVEGSVASLHHLLLKEEFDLITFSLSFAVRSILLFLNRVSIRLTR